MNGSITTSSKPSQWLWTYNNDRPNIPLMVCKQTMRGQWGIGGITPAQNLKMAA
jgi:putative transposase